MLEFVKSIITQFNIVHPNSKGCQFSAEYVSFCLNTGVVHESHNSVVSTNTGRLKHFYEDIDYGEVSDYIDKILSEHKHVFIMIDTNVIAHLFVIFVEDEQYYICDSYEKIRGLSFRIIDMEKIYKVIEYTDLDLWNELFLCDETIEVTDKLIMIST